MALALGGVSRRFLAIAISIVVVAGAIGFALIAVALPAFASTPLCVDKIAGTYLEQGNTLMTLDRDGSVVGQYSKTIQEAAFGPGLGETFSGKWTCKGATVKLQLFRFMEKSPLRYVERGSATGTFDGTRKITVDYKWHALSENATAVQVRTGVTTPVSVPGIVMERVSTP